jgi:DNA-damage-inducible protein J
VSKLSKSATIISRIEASRKEEAVEILKELGLTFSEAINLFVNQLILNKGLPFEVKIPNKETKKAIKDAEDGKNLTVHKAEKISVN